MLYILIFFIAHWYLSLAVQTLFLHRYAAHGYYSLSPRGEKLGYWLNLLFQGSSYLSPYAYGILHKAHHSYSDTKKDPHSPNQHETPVSMMLHTATEYMDIFNKKHELNDVFKPHVTEWRRFDIIASSWRVRVFLECVTLLLLQLRPPLGLLHITSYSLSYGTDTWAYRKLVWTQVWLPK